MYSKETNLKSVNSWNKMWLSWKKLSYVKLLE